MRGSLGIVIGLVVGAGGMYLALRLPGARTTMERTGTGEPVVFVTPSDAGVGAKAKTRKKKRATSGAGVQTGPDEYFEETEPELPPLTEADRRLEWRGDDVTLPATRIDMSGGGEARALDDGEINATVSSQAGAVRDCVVQGATGTDLRSSITVKLVVDGSGRVSKSRIHAPRFLFQNGLLTCTQRALGRMKFPATGAPTLVTIPVNLG